ncbi:MAG: polymorphic toxin-type HINT domain-containing protein, partial [Actinoallomurus sp.]
ANGTVVADAVKLVRDNSADTDNEKKNFSYTYDVNGNLTDLADSSPGARFDDYAMTYDGLDQIAKAEEKASGAVKHTTSYTYDENGDLLSRTHDADQFATFEYDVRDLVTKVTNKESASDSNPKVTTFAYNPVGDVTHQVKGNSNTVDFDYFLDGLLKHEVEKKSNGTVVGEHTLEYDLNGNKTKDAEKKQNADDHASDISTTNTYTYDPRDRLASVTKSSGGSENYVHDDNDNVISQTVGGVTTTSTYDRNRLQYSTANGATSTYNYDPFGRTDTVTVNGTITEKFTYDGFDHVATQRSGTGSAATTTKFTYDPFDRTVTRVADAGGANEKTTTYNYLGTTQDILSEEENGKVAKTYQYGLEGDRLSQVKIASDGSKDPTYYSYSSHADVDAVTDSSGDNKATYGYTAYGANDDSQFSGADKPSTTPDPTQEPYNAYRFNAKRWDPATGDYDMGFRDYDPGLNRFLTRDMYNGALADMNLTTDPFTGNRYAFGGGNPISNVEIDGHFGWGSITGAISKAADWVDDHKAEIAGAVVGTVVGLGCEAALGVETFGTATVGCAALGGAVGNMVTYGMQTPTDQWSLGGFAKSGVEGAAWGAAGAFAGYGASKLLSAAGSKIAPWLGRAGSRVAGEEGDDAARAGQNLAENADHPPAAKAGASDRPTNSGGSRGEPADGAAPSCPNSFAPGTSVLMGDGTHKPIEQVHPGDLVQVGDGASGKTRVARVATLITGQGAKDLVAVSTDRSVSLGAAKAGMLIATAGHPFWVDNAHGFVNATDLKSGDRLRTPDGRFVTVTDVQRWHQWARVFNLGVAGAPHTYFVRVGSQDVLVHNAGGCPQNLSPGNSPAAQAGRAVHDDPAVGDAFDAMGYQRGPTSGADQPDFVTPNGDPVELKPHTRSGMRKGTRQLRRYIDNNPNSNYGELWTYAYENGLLILRRVAIPKPGSARRWLWTK